MAEKALILFLSKQLIIQKDLLSKPNEELLTGIFFTDYRLSFNLSFPRSH